ncbi:MAG: RluA family pseudouridine synthase [bacterium]
MKSSHTVTNEDAGKRLDLFLSQAEADYSRGYFQKLIGEGRVLVGEKPPRKAGQILKEGEAVIVEHPDPNRRPQGENVALDILYEDDQVLAINKPAGMVVHPQDVEEQGTVVHALLNYLPDIAQAVYDPESPMSQLRPGIVHRLDKDTTGVLLIGKTPEALEALSSQFKDHSVEKTYLALVSGTAKEESVTTGMQRKPYRRNMMGVTRTEEEGREAITHFKPVQSFDYFGKPLTLVECRIDTGRTHQIRVHCKFRAHPVLGDDVYTTRTAQDLTRRLHVDRQLLHAARLTFTNPTTGKRQTVEAPLPADFMSVVTRLSQKAT